MVKGKEARVTRYNKKGKEIQNIQRDNKGQDLYDYPYYITKKSMMPLSETDLPLIVLHYLMCGTEDCKLKCQFYCSSCHRPMCEQCRDEHQKSPDTKNHELVPFRQPKRHLPVEKCKEHPTKEIDMIYASFDNSGKQTLPLSFPVTKVSEYTVPGVNSVWHISLSKAGRIWVSDDRGYLIQTDLQGNQLQKIHSRGEYGYHTLTQDGDLIYTDRKNKVIKRIARDNTITEFIKTGDWEPICIYCSRINGDILVGMRKDYEAKVTRYSKTGKEIQTIQRDNKGKELYGDPHYITENINGDICTSDYNKQAVVVVDKSGQYRFSYKGQGTNFRPYGICTDIVGHIIVCDGISVYILNQDDQLLSLLTTQQIVGYPSSLSLDVQNNLHDMEQFSRDHGKAHEGAGFSPYKAFQHWTHLPDFREGLFHHTKDYWDEMDSQEMPKELMERMKIIVQAETHGKSQLSLLDNKIRDLKVRIKRCSKSGNKAYKYTLEHRKRVAQNVRAVYQRYVMKKKVEAARLLIRDFMRQTLPAVRNRVIGQETASSSEETDRE
uniref:Tripartite motif-containing protein 2 n=1 Tax=Magallana gigas TaxID=29159 RepID=K1QDP6_MAGGI